MNRSELEILQNKTKETNALLDKSLNELSNDLEQEITNSVALDNAKYTISSIREFADKLVQDNTDLINELLKREKPWYFKPFNIFLVIFIWIATIISFLNLVLILFL